MRLCEFSGVLTMTSDDWESQLDLFVGFFCFYFCIVVLYLSMSSIHGDFSRGLHDSE